ncbi:MAG: NYN domain-containing protein [Flavobacteriales bacterium]|nr:NYN domain-containing protein [Flavobacteriales bacterium]MCB9166570.1 NYN domain-containing protein [Flavobacteriales bacterium]MCB9194548.1 NYN domain-containing protein [Flavobacteriales bacterium]
MALGNLSLKVGVFYDGSYFTHVSNYYNYVHPHRRRIHIGGLHDYVRHILAEREGTHPNLCHIIDAHFFRGRFTAREANEKPNQLYYDRVFDDVLMYNGVQTHYLPVKDLMGRKREKGVDVLMALETYELCMLKRYDIVVLIASDGDHVPLVRKLHALGCKTMLLGWDFEFTDQESGEVQTTKTSTDLWNEVSYPMPMHDLIEEGLKDDDTVVRELFVMRETTRDEGMHEPFDESTSTEVDDVRHASTVMSLHNGYGFIRYPDNNLFFLHDDVLEPGFNELAIGDEVEFNLGINGKGQRIAKKILKLS